MVSNLQFDVKGAKKLFSCRKESKNEPPAEMFTAARKNDASMASIQGCSGRVQSIQALPGSSLYLERGRGRTLGTRLAYKLFHISVTRSLIRVISVDKECFDSDWVKRSAVFM